jgi:hypothetical protein
MHPRAILQAIPNAKRITSNLTSNLTSGVISSLITLVSMIACTGSFEGGNSSARLVFTVSTAGSLNCLDASGTNSNINVAVGLVITSSNGKLENCSNIPTEGVPYDLVTTPTGDQIIISLPGKGRLELRNNKDLNKTINLQPKTTTEAFCPTRLSLSPDARRIAVLDDPDDTTARSFGCSNNENRASRVLVFDLSNINSSTTKIEPTRVATGGVSGTFQSDRNAGRLAMTINDIQAFVIAPIINYSIFRLNKDNDARVLPQTLNVADLRTPDKNLQLELTNLGSRSLLTVNRNNGNGGAYFINSDFTTEQVSLNGATLKATNRAIWNKRPNDSLIAYLQPGQVIFQRLTGTPANSKAIQANNPIDTAFTLDGYAWVLETGTARRFDITDLATVSSTSQVFLGNFGSRAIGTFLQQQ